MYCMVSVSQVHPHNLGEIVKIYREQSVPKVSKQPGFKSAYYMSKPTGELIILQIWESEEHFNTWNKSAEHAKIISQTSQLQIRPPERHNYELQTYLVADM